MEPTIKELQAQLDNAYWERNQLVLYLAARHPTILSQLYFDDREGSDWFIVFIELPVGQVSWHFHKRELHYFDALPHVRRDNTYTWDMHTTEEKYERMRT